MEAENCFLIFLSALFWLLRHSTLSLRKRSAAGVQCCESVRSSHRVPFTILLWILASTDVVAPEMALRSFPLITIAPRDMNDSVLLLAKVK